MKKELLQRCNPQTLSAFTKDTFEDDSCCSDLTVDLGTSCCAGLAGAYSASQIFSNNVAAPVAFGVVTLTAFAIKALPRQNKKEKFD